MDWWGGKASFSPCFADPLALFGIPIKQKKGWHNVNETAWSVNGISISYCSPHYVPPKPAQPLSP